jgi:hypothetical protein
MSQAGMAPHDSQPAGAMSGEPVAGTEPRRLWVAPRDAAPRGVLGAAAVVLLVVAVTEPYWTVGVAGLITGLALIAVPLAVVATNRAAARRLLRPWPAIAMVAALALFGVGTIRAAGWLYALCVLTALWLMSYAVSAGRRWSSVLLGGGAAWIGILRGRSWVVDGLRAVVRSLRVTMSGHAAEDAGTAPADRGQNHSARLGLPAVLLLTATVLVVFGSLLASADDEFGSLVGRVFSVPSPSLAGRLLIGAGAAAFALGVAFAARRPPRLDRVAASEPRAVRPYEWAVPVGTLVALFTVFALVQFAALFGGRSHLSLTDGLTYATYARTGFAELVVVTVLTLGVLAAVGRWAPRSAPSQRRLVRILAGAICVFALVIVASALYRMHLYQEAYGLTRLRLIVSAFELWLGLVFALVLAAGIRLRATWLPRAVVGSAVAALFALVAINPDAYIAARNVERFEQTGQIDTSYLDGLSADAAPVLMRLPEPERSCALRSLVGDLAEGGSWTEFNLSRFAVWTRAQALLMGLDKEVTCA